MREFLIAVFCGFVIGGGTIAFTNGRIVQPWKPHSYTPGYRVPKFSAPKVVVSHKELPKLEIVYDEPTGIEPVVHADEKEEERMAAVRYALAHDRRWSSTQANQSR